MDRNQWTKPLIYYGFTGLCFIFALALISALVFYSRQTEHKPHVSSTEPARVAQLSADTLYSEYKQNPIAAELKYKSKTVVVSGTIASIRGDVTGAPYLLLAVKDRVIGGVQCYFQKESKYRLARLSKNQRIKIRGRVDPLHDPVYWYQRLSNRMKGLP